MIRALSIALLFATVGSFEANAAPAPLDMEARLSFGDSTYNLGSLSPRRSQILINEIGVRALNFRVAYGTPASFSRAPVEDTAELEAALISLPILVSHVEAGRVGDTNPLATVGPALEESFSASLVFSALHPEVDRSMRAVLFVLADRLRTFAMVNHGAGYDVGLHWQLNLRTLDVWADRPIAFGSALLLAERAAEPQLRADARRVDMYQGFLEASDWCNVAFGTATSATSRAEVALYASVLSDTFARRSRDATVANGEAGREHGPLRWEEQGIESSLRWADRALTEVESHPTEIDRNLQNSVKQRFASAVLRQTDRRLEAMNAGIVDELRNARPTRHELDQLSRAIELGTTYQVTLVTRWIGVAIELDNENFDLKVAKRYLAELVQGASKSARNRQIVCNNLVGNERIYTFDPVGGSLLQMLAGVSAAYECPLSLQEKAYLIGPHLP